MDLIIHEAMGDCLYVMSGLRDVIQARDKFLKRNEHGFQGLAANSIFLLLPLLGKY